jgi:curved DNA-binding protein
MAQNYYDILGVNKTASEKDIKSAYRKMARKLHPDVNPNDDRAQDQFKKVNEAYEVVGDPDHRKDYDQFGDNWKHADQMRNMGARGGRGGRGPGAGGMGFDLNDLFGGGAQSSPGGFGSMFGGAGGHARQQQQHRQPQVTKHKGTIDVSLDEVYAGTTRRITIGTTSNGQRNLEVEVPKGVPDGRKIRLRPDNRSELTLKVNVRADRRFTREGSDLRADISVPLVDAILGGEAEVPTMTGRIALNIPAGTQNGRSFKIKGRGLPKLNSDSHGDLFATVRIQLPENLTDEEQSFFKKMREARVGEAQPAETPEAANTSENTEAAG